MEKTIVHIHSVFRSAALNPDTNPLCALASDVASSLFVKANAHAARCSNKTACFCSMVYFADYKLIGKACVKHSVDCAEESAERDEAFKSLGPVEVRATSRKLLTELDKFVRAVSVVRESHNAIRKILSASAQTMAVECSDLDYDDDDNNVVAIADHTPCSNIDDFLQKLVLSLESAHKLGWVDERVLAAAQAHVESTAAYGWISRVQSWPADVVAAIICCKIISLSRCSTSTIRNTIRKLLKQYGLSAESAHAALESLSIPATIITGS